MLPLLRDYLVVYLGVEVPMEDRWWSECVLVSSGVIVRG